MERKFELLTKINILNTEALMIKVGKEFDDIKPDEDLNLSIQQQMLINQQVIMLALLKAQTSPVSFETFCDYLEEKSKEYKNGY